MTSTPTDTTTTTPTVHPETRMLIDGALVDADSGKTFANVNPATEEVIGEVADASAAEMQRAIAAARRAFDETDWSTNHAFRKQCLLQLHEAIVSGATERLRPVLMTATVATLGMLPAAIHTGVGSDVQRGIATVVVGGLAIATALTLFVLPSMYHVIEHWAEKRSGRLAWGPR